MFLDFNSSIRQNTYAYDAAAADRSEKGERTAEASAEPVQKETAARQEGQAVSGADANPNTLRALEAANLPPTDGNIAMVENMMQEGMRIDRQNLQGMYRLLLKHPEADAAQLVRMKHLGLEITELGIRQFESYENRNHQLLDGLGSVTDAVSKEALSLFDRADGSGVPDSMLLLRDMAELAELPKDEMRALDDAQQWLKAGARLEELLSGEMIEPKEGIEGEHVQTAPVAWQQPGERPDIQPDAQRYPMGAQRLPLPQTAAPALEQAKQVLSLLRGLLAAESSEAPNAAAEKTERPEAPVQQAELLSGETEGAPAAVQQGREAGPVQADVRFFAETELTAQESGEAENTARDAGEADMAVQTQAAQPLEGKGQTDALHKPLQGREDAADLQRADLHPQGDAHPTGRIAHESAGTSETAVSRSEISGSGGVAERSTDIRTAFTDRHAGLLRELHDEAQRLGQLNPKSAAYRIAEQSFFEKSGELQKAIRETVRDAVFGEKGILDRTKNAFTEQLSLRPEDVADERKVDQLYERLLTKMDHLSRSLASAGLGQTQAMDSVMQLQDNVQFMNQLNQVCQYVQLPLSMFEQHTNGELYVYTNKKHLADADGNLSALLHLDMDHIGSLDVHVQMSAQSRVATHFYLPDEEMIDFISQNIHMLDEKLAEKGYQVSSSVTKREQAAEEEKSVIEHILERQAQPVRTRLLSVNSFDMKA